ncbi:MAG: anthranilate synthase component I family protein [Ferruginibacter sp.]|nr:anthranilate synthase component I family protein [Ferruginibacter sp.]MBP7718599.1 anthranilate synthase component I family protein [Ferruginibacter sp.]MBP8611808.1 anthranilate synthase component I family protein [Ferruginibacter sp.]MBP8764605.1 anthranilate synthase component I family protein [Ferruginibacter sp.]MBP9606962.1 anthranilate synthase component I family protein [Ferruginibacter sp.]
MKPTHPQIFITDIGGFKLKLLNWANRFSIFCFLDNNGYPSQNKEFDYLLAAGATRNLHLTAENPFQQLKDFFNEKPGWLFGHLGYDLKNSLENLVTRHPPFINFGIGYFFEPEIIVKVSGNKVQVIGNKNARQVVDEILNEKTENFQAKTNFSLEPVFNKQEYLLKLNQIKAHIQRGDCYEINFCQQFIAHNAGIDAIATFHKLNSVSPNPFASLYKLNKKYCIAASPERFLKKTGNQLICQPIKGTAKRNTQNCVLDNQYKTELSESQKERSENVMIVDLVRNDLSRVCKAGSVTVKELCGIYTFPQVFQMISTIQGELPADIHWADAIKVCFPMGSMTGAPKKRVMELIDQYEEIGRGLFSGSIGYITPQSNFDFNVVIRSIFYDEENQKLSYAAGGGITFNSIAENEYEESLLKAAAIKQVLENQ